ncbi:hypothetical protein GJ744_011065 [Endocarpon pusillum]|uniref:Phytanoyl-CoA dioxygenase n=1 Tax=Endocarpon pusillum TaxID=364733 RepID=A0A8H7E1B8_9EURO|nr:hypothetical protein GJ744_011065 [Endocarpon pusillum]
MTKKLSSLPIVVQVSQEEVSKRNLTWENLETAVRALHRDGLVVLENVIEKSKLDTLNKKMVKGAPTLQSKGENMPYNYNKGNIRQDPPLTKEHFEPSIFLNPIATQVTSAVLGPRPRLSFVSGNTALSPSADSSPQSQPTHSDADIKHPDCPFALVLNIPLVDMSAENGSTEIWLGSHIASNLGCQEGRHGQRASGRIRKDLVEERRAIRPPSQPTVKKGSIIIRNLRLWHGGKPNMTDETRVMLAMIHFAPWYRNPMQVEFADDLIPTLKGHESDLQIQATYIPAAEVEERYFNRPFGNAYDFGQQDDTVDI